MNVFMKGFAAFSPNTLNLLPNSAASQNCLKVFIIYKVAMKLIFYIASVGDNWDKLIAYWTKGPYSHVELMFSDGMCFSSSPRDGGVRFKQIAIDPTHWAIVNINVGDKEAEIREWCQSQCGMKYDWLGVLGCGIHMPFRTKHRWFCSEICITALDKVGVLNLYTLLNPNQFYQFMES